MIEISHLVKKYGDNLAVNDVNMTFDSGKIYGLLGPNGAGKSTIMNTITGYLGATGGEIRINGFDVLAEPEKAKQCIGYLPEIPPLYVDMTVREYMDFAADLKKLDRSKREEQITQAMRLTKIDDIGFRLIRNLSKGYRQRVGLAQAVLGFPEIIILDEPTVGLDPKQIIEIRELIKNLGEKHTVILSSHILQEVSAVCDHIYIIAKGKIVACDTPQNLESQMMGCQELEICVRGNEEMLNGILKNQDMIASYTLTQGKEKDSMQIHLEAKPDADVRETLFYALSDARMPILSMSATGKSLEDVFLELTETEKEAF